MARLGKKPIYDVSQKPRNLTHLTRDRGYRFIERDPVLELITKAITDSGLSLSRISDLCGVSRWTLHAWESGKVKRPQNLTVEFVLKALGYERIIVKRNSNVY